MELALNNRAEIEKRLAEVNASMWALRDPHPVLPSDDVDKWVALYKERQSLERQFIETALV
jgi:hypothetical protein